MAMNITTASLVDAMHHQLSSFESPRTLALLITALLVFITTRLVTGKAQSQTSNGASLPLQAPYYIPFAGHGVSMALNTDNFIIRLMKKYPVGIFTLRLFGSVHHIVQNPSLFVPLINKPGASVEGDWLHDMLLQSSFGLKKDEMKGWEESRHDVEGLWRLLRDEQPLRDLVQRTTQMLKGHLADFVTFNTYPADQMEWEQVADTQVLEEDDNVVETDLHALVKNFVARIVTGAMFGTDFVDNFPEFSADLWAFDEKFVPIAINIPFWVPVPGLQRARAARNRMIGRLEEFHTAFEKHSNGEDPGVRWENLETVGDLLKSRQEVFRKGGLSMHSRACLDLAFLWALNANSNALIFWMIYSICQDPVLLAQIRDEVKPHLSIVQPRNEFGLAVWVAPEIEKADAEALVENCPILKSAYIETLRLYTSSYTFRWIEEDVTIGRASQAPGSFVLGKGSYAHVSHGLHQLNSEYYPDPTEFQSARFLKETIDEDGKKKVTADMGAMRPYGGGPHMCKGRIFATREMMLFVAAILSMYDISPAKGGKFGKVKTVSYTSTRHPRRPVRVQIRRRAAEAAEEA